MALSGAAAAAAAAVGDGAVAPEGDPAAADASCFFFIIARGLPPFFSPVMLAGKVAVDTEFGVSSGRQEMNT